MHGWPQNLREFLPVIGKLAANVALSCPISEAMPDSHKPFSGYEPKTIAQGVLEPLEVEGAM